MKAGFFNHREFIWYVTNYKTLNIRGRYGSGKTLLSVALAYELWKQNYIKHILASFPMNGMKNQLDGIDGDFVMLLDEAGLILDSREFGRNASKEWLKDLRKRKIILVLPSVIDVDKRFRQVVVQRIFMFGNIFWIYRYQVGDGLGVEDGWFGLWKPSWYFGTYDTDYIVEDEDFEKLLDVMARGKGKKIQEKNNGFVPILSDEEFEFESKVSTKDIKFPWSK